MSGAQIIRRGLMLATAGFVLTIGMSTSHRAGANVGSPTPIPVSQTPLTVVLPAHPQIVLAVANSQSMDGDLSGAMMTGSGSLPNPINTGLQNSSSPVNYTVPASFVPPVNTFAMIARLASDSPPPVWQVALTALIGVGAACVTVWFAGKIFKIGLLMHGKPPNFATLIRWAREA